MDRGCLSCSGQCCCDTVVRVTSFDVYRLARVLQIGLDKIVEPCIIANSDGIRLDASDDRYGMILRRNALEPGACAFLMHLPGGTKRCGVYSSRPVVCDVYPFELRDGKLAVRTGVRCGPADWDLDAIDADARRSTLQSYAADWSRDDRITAAWNASSAADGPVDVSFAAYLTFIDAVCEQPGELGQFIGGQNDAMRDLGGIIRGVTEIRAQCQGTGQEDGGQQNPKHVKPSN